MVSAPFPTQPGERIAGKYEIERVIGTGGVGIVVAARHLTLGQTVAIKFLLPGAAHDKNDVLRFEREAQSAVQLKNEHVAQVYDVGQLEDGSPYMVLEYLDGQDLGNVLRASGPLPIVEAVGYMLQICEAVAEAHSIGMVHRDLKPSNFFLTYRRDGFPLIKVLDFGIAKYRIELEQQDVSLTQTRALLGSPVYMSPEQVRSARSVDHRSDIWSLGVCLFELLTDAVPFGGETVTGVAAAVSADPVPPIARYRPDVPEALALVIERCLAKHPDDRYQSVAELAEALVPFGPGDSPYALIRISGTLGIRRSSEMTSCETVRVPYAAIRDATQIATNSQPRPSVHEEPVDHTKRIALSALAAALLIVIGVLLWFRAAGEPTPILSAATIVSVNSVSPIATAPITESPTVTAPPAGVVATGVGTESLGTSPATVVTPSAGSPRTHFGNTPQSRRVAVPSAKGRANLIPPKPSTKKSYEGGSFEDIVDTRH